MDRMNMASSFSNQLPKTFVIWNPNSGRATSAAEIRQWLLDQPQVELHESISPTDARRLAAHAVQQGFELIVAAGGDGAIHAVANGLLAAGPSTEITMGVLPLGTANDFAFSLGVPDDIAQACSLLAAGERRQLDVGEIETATGTEFFLNVATGGNSDRVTEALTDELKKTWGALCYLRGAIAVLTDLTSFQASVVFDDQPAIELSVWNVIVANGRTNAGRLLLAPLASLEDGLLDIVLIRDGTVLDLASLAGQFLLSDYLRAEQVVFRQVRSFSLRTTTPMHFSADGESLSEPPVQFRIRARALKVIVGPEYLPTTG